MVECDEVEMQGVGDVSRRLERHPALKARVGRLLDLVENVAGDVRRADEAERRAMEELRTLGQELLQGWGQGLAESEARELEAGEGVVRQVKKTSLVQHLRPNRGR